MRKLFGVLIIVLGLTFGIYVGMWKCLILGIVGIIDAFRSPESITSMHLAISIVKVLFAGFFGWACGIIPAAFGFWLVVEE
jgi:hypothetical protein